MTLPAVITWRDTVRALAGTCTLRDAAEEAGTSYGMAWRFAKAEGLEFHPPECIGAPDPVEMEEGERMRLLAAIFAAEGKRLARGPLSRRLLELTAADAGSGDVKAALARLREGV